MRYPTERLHRAIALAMELHGDQKRKVSKDPVMCHLVSVSTLVALDGGDEEEIIAGLLHDAVEDAPLQCSIERIRSIFGDRVADMVDVATDTPKDYAGGPKSDWLERKTAYINRIAVTDKTMLRPIAADKVDNILCIISEIESEKSAVDQELFSDAKRQVWYFESTLSSLIKAGFRSELTITLESAIKRLKTLTEGTQENDRDQRTENAA